MKKQFITLTILAAVFLGGCSILEKVDNTITYVNEATDYAGEVDTFVKEVPPLAEQAVSSEEKLLELKTKLGDMLVEIKAFNELEAPNLATDLHQKIIEQNQKAEEGINYLLTQIEDGKLDPAALKNIEIFKSLQEITSTIDQIKQLGQ